MTAAPRLEAWLAPPRPNPDASMRLFCFPYAGGAALAFQAWPEGLPEALEICPLQLPGRGARLSERPYDRMPALIQAAGPALLPRLDLPFAFFGHSLGALVAFELARYLRRHHNLSPLHLFVSGRRAPQLPLAGTQIHDLPEASFLEELRRLNGTPEPVLQELDLMQLLMPMLRADFAVSETYAYGEEAPLDCPISVFGGTTDPLVSQGELQAWRAQTRFSFSLRMLAGDHFFVNDSRAALLSAIAQDLAPYLRRWTAENGA